jgi:hypothetical protein
MKKILILLGFAFFLGILTFNITIGINKQATDICLKNTEALACYTLEYNGTYMHNCCEPWSYVCFSLGNLPGAWEH